MATHILTVPGEKIKFKPHLPDSVLEEIEAEVKNIPDDILLTNDKLEIEDYVWVDANKVDDVLGSVAAIIQKRRYKATGGLLMYYGVDKGNFVECTESHRITLHGGQIKESSGEIKVVRKINRRK